MSDLSERFCRHFGPGRFTSVAQVHNEIGAIFWWCLFHDPHCAIDLADENDDMALIFTDGSFVAVPWCAPVPGLIPDLSAHLRKVTN